MAFGRPVVAFDLHEHHNTAGDAAVYVAGNDEERLAIELRNLIGNGERRRSMERTGRQRFRDSLAWENSEKTLIESYRQLLEV